MVSLRRRKNLGLPVFPGKASTGFEPKGNAVLAENLTQNVKSINGEKSSDDFIIQKSEQQVELLHSNQNVKLCYEHPLPSDDSIIQKRDEQESNAEPDPGSSNLSGSGSLREEPIQRYPDVKRRKKHKRKRTEDTEKCVYKGVYFKNQKWQAAIKVEKKQIHLGTFDTQVEAAHLYDRAALLCNRETNFPISEEEKRQLDEMQWDGFLAMTRSSITNKKYRKRIAVATQRMSDAEMHEDSEYDLGVGGSPASDEVDRSAS